MGRMAMMIVMMVCRVAAVAQVLPGDGECLSVYGLDAGLGQPAGGVYDLSSAAVTDETDMRFEYYGDTLVRVIAGPRADWLRISGDTIWSAGTDTRQAHHHRALAARRTQPHPFMSSPRHPREILTGEQ